MSNPKPRYATDYTNLERDIDNRRVIREKSPPVDQAAELAQSMAARLDAAAKVLGLSAKNYDSNKLQNIIAEQGGGRSGDSADDVKGAQEIEPAVLEALVSDSGGETIATVDEQAEGFLGDNAKANSDVLHPGAEVVERVSDGQVGEEARRADQEQNARALLESIHTGGNN